MKKILKKEVIIAFIVGIILASSIAVYAANYSASQVTYKDGKTVEYALNDLYNATKQITEYSANFHLSGAGSDADATTSYFEIDCRQYNKIRFDITELYSQNTSVFTSYILVDGTNVKNISETGEFEINVSSNSTVKVYYYENSGYYHITGSYILSK